jgi:type II secretory pathway component PulC
MKFFAQCFALACALTVMLGVSVFAGEVTKTVTFNRDINVNGTVIKKGEYKVRINKETGELTILKGKEVLAKVKTSTVQDAVAARADEVRSDANGTTPTLTGLKFGGSKERIVVADTASPNQ